MRRLGTGATSLAFALGSGLVLMVLDLFWERLIDDGSLRQLVMLAACNVLVALSLNIINGLAGQFSIGHAGFVGVGAYTTAVLCSHLHLAFGGGEPTLGRSFVVVPICLVASAVIAGAFGFVVGLPSLRLRGDYLAIVTLGFAEIFRLTIASAGAGETGGAFALISRLGGQNGYQGIGNQGVPLFAGPFWILGVAIALGVVAWRIKFSGWGRALRALREDEIAAAAVGVDPTRYKVTSFVLAAVGAGIAGALTATMRDGSPVVNPDSYGFAASFDAITMVILGGSGSITGATVGAVLVTFTVKAIELVQASAVIQALKADHPALDLNALRMMVYAVVLVLLMAWRPEGLFGERELRLPRRLGGKG
jgi:branched-chain amino acid transport system permease protein